MNRIVITGGAGFIGMHLAQQLASNPENEIVVLDNFLPAYGGNWSRIRAKHLSQIHHIQIKELDLVTTSTLELTKLFQGSSAVFHLAAWPGVRTSQLHPYEYSKANLTGFGNVLEAVRLSQPGKFLFASSSSIYSDLGTSGPVKEEHAHGENLKSYYAATKWANEILAESYSQMSGVPTIALRFFTVYGEFGRPDMAYWTFLEKMLNDENISLYGSTGGSRNFTHVKDAVLVLENLLNAKVSGYSAINISAGEPYETLEFLKTISRFAKIEPKITVTERPQVDVEKTWADLTKLKQLVGEIENTPLEIGLKNFVDWYLKAVKK